MRDNWNTFGCVWDNSHRLLWPHHISALSRSILNRFYICLQPFPPFTLHLCRFLRPIHPLLLESKTQKGFIPFLPMLWVLYYIVNGTHIHYTPSATDCDASKNHKSKLTQNCLIICSFDLCFLYLLSSWKGSTHDLVLFNNVC